MLFICSSLVWLKKRHQIDSQQQIQFKRSIIMINKSTTYPHTWAGLHSRHADLLPGTWSCSLLLAGSPRSRWTPMSHPLRTGNPPSCCRLAHQDRHTAPDHTLEMYMLKLIGQHRGVMLKKTTKKSNSMLLNLIHNWDIWFIYFSCRLYTLLPKQNEM